MRSMLAGIALLVAVATARAEGPLVKYGDPVPRDVREIYDAGLRCLLKTQDASGAWKSQHGTPAPTGMALMVLLASGEDPNHGPYRAPIRRALRALINEQDGAVGYIGGEGGNPSMYHHGFAMLSLAEAYGVVDDRGLWSEPGAAGGKGQGRSIGKALELAVRAAVTANKKNPTGGWHYGPEMPSADTSVSGAVLMGLLAARNAGIEVPDETIDRAIKYYVTMTGGNGNVGYSGGAGNGTEATTSIGVLVFSIARRQALPQYKSAKTYLEKASAGGAVVGDRRMGIRGQGSSYEHYYRAQALFQCDVAAWEKWNAGFVKTLKSQQAKDGSFTISYGTDVDTPLTLLALAVNYKFLPVYER
jgi:hypothetical protein